MKEIPLRDKCEIRATPEATKFNFSNWTFFNGPFIGRYMKNCSPTHKQNFKGLLVFGSAFECVAKSTLRLDASDNLHSGSVEQRKRNSQIQIQQYKGNL